MIIPENLKAMPTRTPKIQFRAILIYKLRSRPTSPLEILEMCQALILQ